jgi:UDP-N-acetylmuramate--alanine ligase
LLGENRGFKLFEVASRFTVRKRIFFKPVEAVRIFVAFNRGKERIVVLSNRIPVAAGEEFIDVVGSIEERLRDRIAESLFAPLGKHNVENALCALAVARALELDVKKAADTLADFSGVERRMATIYSKNNIVILDDYAHNPGKVAACISSVKEAWPDAPLHVVYQAHRFSRLETMFDSMLDALKGADHVYVLPVYSAGEKTDQDFSPARLAKEIRSRTSQSTIACASFEEAVNSVKNNITPPAIVLTVGAGDVWKIGEQLREDLA